MTIGILALLSVVAAGCRALPESGVKSFADSTSLLSTTLATAGKAAVSEVAQIYHAQDSGSKEQAKNLSKELETEWKPRLEVMAAMNRYAATLQGLVDAGNSGQANAQAFSDSVKGLVEAAGGAFPGAGSAGQLLIDAGTRVYGEIARAVAANQIHKAVDLADPLISDASKLIARDLDNLRSIAIESHATAVSVVQLRRIHREVESLNDARSQAASLALRPSADAAAIANLAAVNALYAHLPANPEYLAYVADLQRANHLFAAQTALIDQATLTTRAWADGHHELAIALRQKRAPSMNELTRLTMDLYEVYKGYRDARHQP